jgi:hypothetical protein
VGMHKDAKHSMFYTNEVLNQARKFENKILQGFTIEFNSRYEKI